MPTEEMGPTNHVGWTAWCAGSKEDLQSGNISGLVGTSALVCLQWDTTGEVKYAQLPGRWWTNLQSLHTPFQTETSLSTRWHVIYAARNFPIDSSGCRLSAIRQSSISPRSVRRPSVVTDSLKFWPSHVANIFYCNCHKQNNKQRTTNKTNSSCLLDLQCSGIEDRSRTVELWSGVAQYCLLVGNYNSATAILESLESPPIARLQITVSV